MSTKFWVKRFPAVLAGAFTVICAAQMIKGHGRIHSATQGVVWGLIAAAIFTGAGLVSPARGSTVRSAEIR